MASGKPSIISGLVWAGFSNKLVTNRKGSSTGHYFGSWVVKTVGGRPLTSFLSCLGGEKSVVGYHVAGPRWQSSETVLQPTAKELAPSACEPGSPPSQASLAVTAAQDHFPGHVGSICEMELCSQLLGHSPSLSCVSFDAAVPSLVSGHICISQPETLQPFCVCWDYRPAPPHLAPGVPF